MTELKVYHITGYRPGLVHNANGSSQSHEIVAAKSGMEAAKLFGCSHHHLRSYGGVTGNAKDIETALTKPGTVFYKSMNDFLGNWREVPA